MSDTRIEIVGGKPFEPRDWLRRELVWTLVKVPRQEQLSTFLNGRAWDVHSGNLSRTETYAKYSSSELQALSFFNQGKTSVAFLTWSSLFRIMMNGDAQSATLAQNLKSQAHAVDSALAKVPQGRVDIGSRKDIYVECVAALEANKLEPSEFRKRRKLLEASKKMTQLATNELVIWDDASRQNDEGTLDRLIIEDGGTPRTDLENPFIKSLLPVFNSIVTSEDFLRLS